MNLEDFQGDWRVHWARWERHKIIGTKCGPHYRITPTKVTVILVRWNCRNTGTHCLQYIVTSVFTSNSASNGGAISTYIRDTTGHVTITQNTTFQQNTATGSGDSIYCNSGKQDALEVSIGSNTTIPDTDIRMANVKLFNYKVTE